MTRGLPVAARLSSKGRYTYFEHGGTTPRFIAPAPPGRRVSVTERDRGCLVAQAGCSACDEPVGEYIDPAPVPGSLPTGPDESCSRTERAEASYA